MTADAELTLEHIAQRLFELAEAERDMRALEAVQAYQAAAQVLSMAKPRPLFPPLFGDPLSVTSLNSEQMADEPWDEPEPAPKRRWWRR